MANKTTHRETAREERLSVKLSGDVDVAVKVPLHQYEATVALYRLVEETRALLAQCHRRTHNGALENYLSRIVVRSRQKAKVVDVAEIDWIETTDDYLKLHAGDHVHLMRGSLAALEKRLDPAEFARIHRSTIVRLSRVKEMEPYFHGDYSITLVDGTRLRLSRTYRASFQAALGHAI